MSDITREVAVLAGFTDARGVERKRGEVLTLPYNTPRQRTELNSMVYRGFLTLDVTEAKKHFEEDEAKTQRAASRRARREPS